MSLTATAVKIRIATLPAYRAMVVVINPGIMFYAQENIQKETFIFVMSEPECVDDCHYDPKNQKQQSERPEKPDGYIKPSGRLSFLSVQVFDKTAETDE